MSRISAGGPRDLGPVTWLGSRIAGRVTGTEPPAFITVLGRGRRQFWGWLAFAGSLMPLGHLPRPESEAVILRVSALVGCAYEHDHHRRIGAKAGLSREQIADTSREQRDRGLWTPRADIVLDTVDELVASGDLDDASWARLRTELDERESLELVQLIGQYVMLATTLRVLRVEPDRPRASRGSTSRSA